MKKTMFIAITLVLSGLTAHAANLQSMNLEKIVGNQDYQILSNEFDAPVGTAADKFQQIIDLAHQGQPVSFDDAEGVYTGRCYWVVARDIPCNSVLVIIQVPTNDGPLFPTEKVVVSIYYRDGAADYADSLTKEALISDAMSLKSHFSNV